MVIKANGGHIEFCLDKPCVRDRPCFIVFRMKTEQNSRVIVKFNAILGVLTIYANSRQNSETFDVLHAFLPLVVAKL